MDIKFTADGKVEISMEEYIQECTKAYGEDIRGTSATPAKEVYSKCL